MFSDLYHVLPSVPVSITNNTYCMKFGYFGISFNVSGLYVPHVVHFTWDSLTYHDNWHFRHYRTGSPGTLQARHAGNFGRRAWWRFSQKTQSSGGKLCRATMHHSCLHPVKNPAPPLGGVGHTDGSFKRLERQVAREPWNEWGRHPRTPQREARFCPEASPRCG